MMKSIYFLPYSGIQKFDDINDKQKLALSKITEVKSFLLDKQIDYFPENFTEVFPELFFIPTFFDYRNCASYQGVEFAMRWYFYIISLNHKCSFKIVLLGTENKSAFFQNCNYSNFLKCPNIDYIQNSFEDINQYISDYKTIEFKREDALERIELIGIKPPTSYKSHHSIANEWSILRWAKALNLNIINEKRLEKIETDIGTSLYYKFLNTKYPISINNTFKSKILLNSGKILFIDDEVDKGWDAIFKTICNAKSYTSFGQDFKNWDQSKIIDESFKKAKDADVIILDLRLHDDDFDEKDSKEITGYKLLRKIKEHNKGIQVIIFSATNKIWNLQALQEAEADGFIMKESPKDSTDGKFTTQSIENIYKTIDKCLEYSFLKKYFEKLNYLKQELEPRKNPKTHPNPLPKEFVEEYLKWLEFAIFNILTYKSNTGNILSFSLFFSVLENISNRIIDIDNPDKINSDQYKFKFRTNNTYLKDYSSTSGKYSNTNSDLVSRRNINWNQKILNTLQALSSNLTDMNSLIQKRNDIIHSNSTTGNTANINKEELNKIFKIITENIENIN